MRTLIVGDVHGCAAELRALVDVARPDRLILVGDLYTKGPDPCGVWRVIRAHRAEAVLGNHDARLLDVLDGRRTRDAEGRACVDELDSGVRGWRDHLAALPLFLEVEGWTVVHAGLHPSGDLAATSRSTAISVRRFPGTSDADPWWVDAYVGARRVVYGHDARRGVVVHPRDGRPWLVGLDSGCVYGGQLTGLLVEEERLLQVPARQVYAPISG